jgi:hypothetical protein
VSVYTYPQSKVIDEITFKKTENGAVRAYLHAGADVTPDKIKPILEVFKTNGWQAVPFNLDGKPTLEVRGLKTEEKFIEFLKEQQWVQGAVEITRKEKPLSFMDKFKKRTLQASGVAMTIADTGFIIYGLKEAKLHKTIDPTHEKRDFREALAGLAYLSGSTALGVYGRNDQSDLQVRDVAKAILKHAKDKGLVVPEDSAVQSVGGTRKENVLTKTHNFLRTHPSEVGNMAYFTAGLLISSSALQNRALAKPRPGMTPQQIKEMRKGGWGDTALGASTMVSGLIGTLVKEKAEDPSAQNKVGLDKWWDKLKRSPLTIASLGYMGSTLCHAYTTYIERKEAIRASADMSLSMKERQLAGLKRQAVPWRVLFIGATLVGEVLLAVSSKGHGEGVQVDDTVDQSVYAVTADLIARQPANVRTGLIDYMSGYLADPKVLGGNRLKITKELTADVECLLKNPWVVGAGQAQDNAVSTPIATAKVPPNWQVKVSASPPAAQPSLST